MADAAPFGRGRVRRLFGLDRSGPQPQQTRKGAPLRPWTIPNLVGYVRLAAIPLFLYLAFESGDGRSAPAAIVFWLIAAGDYLDGFLARVTGQYSRMGALLDPLVDRLTILSGAVVCWNFELLPRWALALLALREVAMLVLAQHGLRHGVDIEVNWPGRVSVFPIMGGIFFAMVFAGWVPAALLIAGLALAILATVLYARTGLRAVRRARELQAGPHSP
jgi:cardiolipin synthase